VLSRKTEKVNKQTWKKESIKLILAVYDECTLSESPNFVTPTTSTSVCLV